MVHVQPGRAQVHARAMLIDRQFCAGVGARRTGVRPADRPNSIAPAELRRTLSRQRLGVAQQIPARMLPRRRRAFRLVAPHCGTLFDALRSYPGGVGNGDGNLPAYRPPAKASASIRADGTVLVRSGTYDLGTGTYTVMTQSAWKRLACRDPGSCLNWATLANRKHRYRGDRRRWPV